MFNPLIFCHIALHGRWQGDVDVWISADGEEWAKFGVVAPGVECTSATLRHLPKCGSARGLAVSSYALLHLCDHLTMVFMLAEPPGNRMDVAAGCASNGDLVAISSGHSPALPPGTDRKDFEFEAYYNYAIIYCTIICPEANIRELLGEGCTGKNGTCTWVSTKDSARF